jgi:hypothetical protein
LRGGVTDMQTTGDIYKALLAGKWLQQGSRLVHLTSSGVLEDEHGFSTRFYFDEPETWNIVDATRRLKTMAELLKEFPDHGFDSHGNLFLKWIDINGRARVSLIYREIFSDLGKQPASNSSLEDILYTLEVPK